MGKPFDIQTILHNVSKIRLPGGMVGKVCTVLIVVAIAMAGIAWTVKLPWVSALAIVLVFLLSFVMLWRVITFADRNPQAAILEGAEFLLHAQLMLGTKANPQITAVIQDYIEGQAVALLPDEQKRLLLPDPSGEQSKDVASQRKEAVHV